MVIQIARILQFPFSNIVEQNLFIKTYEYQIIPFTCIILHIYNNIYL